MLDVEIIKSTDWPLDYKQVGPLLDRMAQSRALLWFLRSAASHALKPIATGSFQPTICAFGSLGRGEFDFVHSDIDLMFVGMSAQKRDRFLKHLTETNQCFNFEDLSGLLRSKTPQNKAKVSLRFPALKPDFFKAGEEEHRRRTMQFLLESLPIHGDKTHSRLIKDIITDFGLVPKHKLRQTPQRFIAALDIFYSTMQDQIRMKDGKASDYFVKYIINRVLGEHFIRLALVQAMLCRKRVRLSTDPPIVIANILRQPALSKLLFWASREFLDWHCMRSLKERHFDLTRNCIARSLKVAGLDALSEECRMNPDEIISTVVINAAKAYGATLDYLHTSEFRSILETKPANFVNWNSDPNLKQIQHQVSGTSKWISGLCQILVNIFPLAEELGCFNKGYSGSGLEFALLSCEKRLSEKTY